MKTEMISNKNRTRLILTMLMLIFAMPFAAAWFIYNFTDIGRTDKGGNYGELVVPPISIPDLKLLDSTFAETDHSLHGKWSLLYVTAGDCALECKRRLDVMQGMIYGLEKDSGRVQAIIAITEGTPGQGLQDYLGSNNGKKLLLLPDQDSVKEDVFEPGKLYIIDPLGNLMMSYSSDSNLEGVTSDLKRLLRYSRIG